MAAEARTRVTFFLPVGTSDQILAAMEVQRYLKSLTGTGLPVTGFTHSVFKDPSFIGKWWSPETGAWVPDHVSMFIIDYGTTLDDSALDRAVNRLKRAIQRRYAKFGSPQEEIWVIAQRAMRYM